MAQNLMTTGDVARMFGVSRQRIHQLDSELQPERLPSGQRLFRPDVVKAVAKRRARVVRGA